MTQQGLHLDAETAADVATDLWRARRRLARAGGDRMLTRHLDGLHDRLARAGLEVQEHEGLVVDAGTALDVVAWEIRPDVERDVVVETVAPSVYCAGRQIRIGQVVVARPEDRGDGGGGAPDG
ncbi:hypothetical protein [Pseudonocardia lacus]|uniref:hypothetical protein n=1 Tax=Pseudonocardia lacus TaxID=2835865 RepID=UPI001BDC2483|nr:hypothetical protein [Pseudonocardia lacus]